MDLIVSWSDKANNDLENVFDYYKIEANLRVARKLVKALVSSTIQLKYTPHIGAVETLFTIDGIELRYLVKGNYKILYYIQGSTVIIARVFDCRQNPNKMK
ncbi:MAG: type II toxin-antitoxin system RelE/ParE family toxin [Sphingobacteriales bacterium JAD_PAG50586_3]|nr:MAG: type II toxin-antitoxin system RelE/ParE family toxin [Sphingobacteriales bacterium JAD_PAG50586_3]